ncbi:hypothetical protein UCRPA7_3615 [Phaeoacremonium minimum UCRPA7]|uniref:Uncharacterized protein n=1 Tax=Phaeoacremonium minimum (strain UCR-PA7) TaxID=1286976 RepID=R8BNN4_PHAM7|nr:hypothetical protein UCRPA7_3615 [Phaeoacremonium minimum UCRPA7]EOO00944.1 hypothetical protein UCRPA7_3615 [Phaeoacremonium minimum UCRPA7]
MLGQSITVALLGLGASTWAAPAPSRTIQERGGVAPDPAPSASCIPDILKYFDICILPGTITGGFKPPKRQTFVLPPDNNQNLKDIIKDLETQYITLKNKNHRTAAEEAKLKQLKSALAQLGITNIDADPGVITTITPGKRQIFELPDDSPSGWCADVTGAELALEDLIHATSSRAPTVHEYFVMNNLKSYLSACGIKIVSSPDGTTTIIRPGKRDIALPTNRDPGFDLEGLELAYKALTQSLNGKQATGMTWFVLQNMATALDFWGISIDKSPLGTSTTLVPGKRQGDGIFTIGTPSCELTDIVGLKAALAALQTMYGSPAKSPQNIFLIEQLIVSALQYCGQTVPGWTTLTPGNPIPGGPLVPDPTVPGGPITPDPTVPGGPITPDPTVPGGPLQPSTRQLPVSDPAGLLAAINDLESKYGKYGSGTIPVPVFLIMQNIVTILQGMGVTVPGWPILGAGSVVIGPSS